MEKWVLILTLFMQPNGGTAIHTIEFNGSRSKARCEAAAAAYESRHSRRHALQALGGTALCIQVVQ